MLKKITYILLFICLSVQSNAMEDPRASSEMSQLPQENSDNLSWNYYEAKAKCTRIKQIKFNADDETICILGDDCCSAEILNIQENKSIQVNHNVSIQFIEFHEKYPNLLAIALNYRTLILDKSGKVQLGVPNESRNVQCREGEVISCLKFYSEFKKFVLGFQNGAARIRSIRGKTSTIIDYLNPDTNNQVNLIAFGKSDTKLALASYSGKIRIYEDDFTLKYIANLNDEIESIKFEENGSQIFITGKSKNYLMHLKTPDNNSSTPTIPVILIPEETIIIDYCPYANKCLTVNGNQIIENELLFTEDQNVKKAYYNYQGNLIITILENGISNVWSKQKNQWVYVCQCNEQVKIALSPKNNFFITYDQNSNILRIWRNLEFSPTTQTVNSENEDHKENNLILQTKKRCRLLKDDLVPSNVKNKVQKKNQQKVTIKLSNNKDLKWTGTDFKLPFKMVKDLYFNNKDAIVVITGENNDYAKILNIGALKFAFTVDCKTPITCSAFHAESDILAVGTASVITLLDAKMEEAISVIYSNRRVVDSMITYCNFLPLNQNLIVAIGYDNGTVSIRRNSGNNWRTVFQIDCDNPIAITSISFNSQGNLMALATSEGTLKIYNTDIFASTKCWSSPTIFDLKEEIKSIKFDSNDRTPHLFVETNSKRYFLNCVEKTGQEITSSDYCSATNSFLEISEKKLYECKTVNNNHAHSKFLFEADHPIQKAFYNAKGNLIVIILENGNSNIWSKENDEWLCINQFCSSIKVIPGHNNKCFITYDSDILTVWQYEPNDYTQEVPRERSQLEEPEE